MLALFRQVFREIVEFGTQKPPYGNVERHLSFRYCEELAPKMAIVVLVYPMIVIRRRRRKADFPMIGSGFTSLEILSEAMK